MRVTELARTVDDGPGDGPSSRLGRRMASREPSERAGGRRRATSDRRRRARLAALLAHHAPAARALGAGAARRARNDPEACLEDCLAVLAEAPRIAMPCCSEPKRRGELRDVGHRRRNQLAAAVAGEPAQLAARLGPARGCHPRRGRRGVRASVAGWASTPSCGEDRTASCMVVLDGGPGGTAHRPGRCQRSSPSPRGERPSTSATWSRSTHARPVAAGPAAGPPGAGRASGLPRCIRPAGVDRARRRPGLRRLGATRSACWPARSGDRRRRRPAPSLGATPVRVATLLGVAGSAGGRRPPTMPDAAAAGRDRHWSLTVAWCA